ncbi:AbrB/MazE/SpoVT family DNA-binding domain-containing protein [Patescibacteria group bacterium]|nr:AbrB/MazE/SpoVT family DNA-binding domain-containing protein [Patescibacteria group bacterium]
MTPYQPKMVRKIFQTGEYSYVITLPKDLIKHLGWQKGDMVEVNADRSGHQLIIKKFKF